MTKGKFAKDQPMLTKLGDLCDIVRGFAHENRIAILAVLKRHPELSVSGIADEVDLSLKNTSKHIQCLVRAGLVMKRSAGNRMLHKLTDRGEKVLQFLKTLK